MHKTSKKLIFRKSKKIFTWKIFRKISEKFKILKKIEIFEKFQIISDLITWLCLLIWHLSDLNLAKQCLEVGENSIFSYFWCSIWTVKPLKTIPRTPQDPQRLPLLSSMPLSFSKAFINLLKGLQTIYRLPKLPNESLNTPLEESLTASEAYLTSV